MLSYSTWFCGRRIDFNPTLTSLLSSLGLLGLLSLVSALTTYVESQKGKN